MSENTNVVYGSIKVPTQKELKPIFDKFAFNPDWIKPVECAKVVPQGIHLA